ncbi:MAG: AMP-binding protein [Janthinobacterium lividum]
MSTSRNALSQRTSISRPAAFSSPTIHPQAVAERLYELIEGPAADAQLLSVDGKQVTFGQMRQQAAAIARGLKASGLARGDTLALWLPNVAEWIAVTLACSRLGVAAVSLNPRWSDKEVGDLISRAACKAVVLAPHYRDGAALKALRAVERSKLASLALVIVYGDAPVEPVLNDIAQIGLAELAQTGGAEVEDGQPDDPILITATSGTTSLPKLVLHVQRSVCRHAADVARVAGLLDDADTRMLLGVPFCGAYGYTIAVSTLYAQRPLIVMDVFDPAAAGALIREHAITHMLGTNDMLDKLLDAAPGARPFPSLRLFGHANFVPSLNAMPPKAEAAGVLIRGFFGMSELLAGFAVQPADAPLARRAEAGGVPTCAQATFVIRDPDTGRDLADGEVGELLARTPNRMREYLNNPSANAAAFTDDGYFRTGDLAYRLPEGGFNFVSRMNDVLRIGGYLVSPIEIEEVIESDAAVDSCQVVAVLAPQGVRPVAFVVARAGQVPDEATLLQHCREKLAVYKVPIRIFPISEVPMVDSPNGPKVKRNALRDLALQLLGSGASN